MKNRKGKNKHVKTTREYESLGLNKQLQLNKKCLNIKNNLQTYKRLNMYIHINTYRTRKYFNVIKQDKSSVHELAKLCLTRCYV